MMFFFSFPTLVVVLVWLPIVMPFTIILTDSGTPSALVDAPQTGFSMNKNGARTNPREQAAVYEIMKATGNGWATDIPDVCRGRWHGIECMPDKDEVYHVVSLSFGALSDDTAFPTCDQKRSFISPAITKLPHLRTLFFYRCFSYNPQPIPTFLGQLGPTLQTLVLRENGHVGPIPTELGNLTSLKVLDLHKNKLNGSIPVSFKRLTHLKSMDLSVNRLTGQIPGLNNPGLSILDLNQNLLTGYIPPSIANCPSLLKMDLSRNHLSGPIPDEIGYLRNLVLLDLSYNQLLGPLPSALGKLGALQALILKGNPMDSTMITGNWFDGLKDLMILILSDTSLHGPIPESLGLLPSLRVIHLDRNKLNGSIPTSFLELKGLSELRLNDNQLTGQVPFVRETVWKMGQKLRLYNNTGLCYDPQNGLDDDIDSLVISGISYCETSRSTSIPTTMHLSNGLGHKSIFEWRSSAQICSTSIGLQVLLLMMLLLGNLM
ncbi:Leucine-rich repeat receptor-like protein kinase pxl1 [Thalictrum thalictroides]|uniref:Leucine-rich repeat receptor-like protein kinase pxl1 n=1 Tax=Thalictrum thalictroides TaxID=46969 RepID=A0A7J6UU39_THATH|nr:Leucine-rich repeat receptor-like protein kinase pxl1 [Thalictrum thalictroides]